MQPFLAHRCPSTVTPLLLIVALCPFAPSLVLAQSFVGSGIAVSPAVAPAPAADMQTIGRIGDITWVSSIKHHRTMDKRVLKRFGDNSSARVLMCSIEFGEFS
jgi:hypothetical protein